MPDRPPEAALRRNRAIRLTVGASVGAKVISVACTLAQVPIALHYLGPEAYGLWMTITSVVLILNTVDFGVGVGMQHAMATAYGRGDADAIRRLFWTGTGLLAALSVTLLLAGAAVIRAKDWSDVLKLADPGLRAQTQIALTVALGAVTISLPFNAVNRLAAGMQLGWVNSGWVAAGSAMSLGLVALASHFRWGFAWFLGASLMLPAIQGAGLLVHLCVRLEWSLFPVSLAGGPATRRLLNSSLWYVLPQAGQALAQSLPALAIMLAAGPDAVTAYSLIMRLFGLLQQGQVMLLTPVWPAYAEASVRGDSAWIRRTYRHSILASAALVAAAALLGWNYHRLLHLWVGSAADMVSYRLAGIAGVWFFVQMAAQPPSYLLMGIGRLRELAWSASPGLFLSVGACFWGVSGGTAASVLTAGSIAFAAFTLPPLLLTASKCLGSAGQVAVAA